MSSHFVKQTSFAVDYSPAHVTKWRSSRTGLQLTYVNQPSPIVSGYFAVATEIADDSGCPHTLEHLIFMGSKTFPYKGLLDNLGNRMFSSTNAWTGVDQTVYTLTTAGWEGFRILLPIYLEHLLYPTLTEEACLTEVYHIDGKGHEKGVVFSEIQGIENESWFKAYAELQKTLYAPESGYSSETGGMLVNLRNLTNDQIRHFHKVMYRPDNLCVIITGSIDEEELLQVMSDFDKTLDLLPETSRAKRPFVDSPLDEPLKETIVKSITFPDTDESIAEFYIAWIGPDSKDVLMNTAVDSIGSYFTDSPISLFNKALVEIENPLATEIDYSTDDYMRTALNFSVSGVPTEKLEFVDQKLKELIKSQIDPKNFDLKYMAQVLKQQKLKFVSQTEKSPQTFSNIAISEFIYGNTDGSDLAKWSKDLNEYDKLASWTAEQWSQVIKEQFVDNHSATILARPSASLEEEMRRQHKHLMKETKKKYGKEGLAKLGEKLRLAQEKNDKPIPDSVITNFGKPDPSKIAFIDTKSYKAGLNTIETTYVEDDALSKLIKKDTPENFPLFFHFEEYRSEFISINVVTSSTGVEPQLLKYLSIMEEIFSLSIRLPDGQFIPYEEVVFQINDDLIEFQVENGFESQFLELLNIRIKLSCVNYQKGIKWLLNVLKYSVFEQSRIKVIIEKIINSTPEKKRSGELMMYSAEGRTLFNDGSIRKAQDFINTDTFYKDLLEKIEQGNYSDVEADLNKLRDQLFNLDNLKLFIVGGITNIKNPVSSWVPFYNALKGCDAAIKAQSIDELPHSHMFLSEVGKKCSKDASLIVIPGTESTHFVTSVRIPTDYLHEDMFKISLANAILTAVEGPFWRGIRGTGLAYGALIRRNVDTGFLSFIIYRGSAPEQAINVAKQIIDEHIDGKAEISPMIIENAIASLVNEMANGESNSYEAATSKISDNIFRKRGPHYVKTFLQRMNQLTADDVRYALKKYFAPMFSAETSVIFCSLPLETADEFKSFLHTQGYDVHLEHVNAAIDSGSEEEEDSMKLDDEFSTLEEETSSGEEEQQEEVVEEDDDDDDE